MNAFEMAALSSWSMENGPPSQRSTDEACAAPETNSSPHYGASRQVASPRIAAIRILVIPPGYQQIPGYEAHRQRLEARVLMGSIAERRGKTTPAPILIHGVPGLPSRRRRWYDCSKFFCSLDLTTGCRSQVTVFNHTRFLIGVSIDDINDRRALNINFWRKSSPQPVNGMSPNTLKTEVVYTGYEIIKC
ncbi:hypothetical protein N7472_006581 [Penicillium cf. griseofulvum]|uniref:Uncharacterized protein n=1 Tax=Penicillium cf. griseofulvum TaxID=2972120 RepID=A0A9W9JFP8_9EURO|nr:hypothetical protein N7472_006581 [Penicillium cf. griseofulvum]